MTGRVHRKPSLQQADRLPISSYDDAVWKLVQIRLCEWLPDVAYDAAVELVADIFWKSDHKVRRDVIVASHEIGG